MKSLICFCFFALIGAVFSPTVSAQAPGQIISGIILDSRTDMPIEFAAIGIRGTPKGTVTNALGAFRLQVPPGSDNDTVFVSMIGYHLIEMRVKDVRHDTVIRMSETPLLLKEIVITDKRSSVDDILRAIKQNLKRNYPVNEFAVECFYREIRKENESYKPCSKQRWS